MPSRHRRLHEAPGQGAIELPAQWYCQGEPFQEERHKVFAPAWQLLGRASVLRKPGDYLCANLAGWPLVALVNGEGKPAAFHIGSIVGGETTSSASRSPSGTASPLSA